MRWQLAGDWPIGQFCIPAGTVLSSGAGEAPIWNGVALPMPPPLNAVALDAEATLYMLQHYDPDLWHQLVFAAGVDRAALIAQAAHERRYGRQAAVAVAIAAAAESPPVTIADSPLEGNLPQKEEAAPPAPRSTTRKRK